VDWIRAGQNVRQTLPGVPHEDEKGPGEIAKKGRIRNKALLSSKRKSTYIGRMKDFG